MNGAHYPAGSIFIASRLSSSGCAVICPARNWEMKTKTALALIAMANLVLSGAALSAGAKTYQVTGTVVSATASKVTLQKGSEQFEIDVDPATVKGSDRKSTRLNSSHEWI